MPRHAMLHMIPCRVQCGPTIDAATMLIAPARPYRTLALISSYITLVSLLNM